MPSDWKTTGKSGAIAALTLAAVYGYARFTSWREERLKLKAELAAAEAKAAKAASFKAKGLLTAVAVGVLLSTGAYLYIKGRLSKRHSSSSGTVHIALAAAPQA